VANVTYDNLSVRQIVADDYDVPVGPEPAQFYTDYTEHTVGQAPADHTKRWHDLSDYTVEDGGSLGGDILRMGNDTGDNLQFYSWDTPGETSDVEILFRHRANSATSGSYAHGAVVRGSGDSTTETGYIINFDRPGQNYKVMRYLNASGSTLQTVAFTHGINDWVWTRLLVNGTSIKSRSWLGSFYDEPDTWPVDLTNDVVAGPGRVGYFSYQGPADEYSFFSVGTEGATAPGPNPVVLYALESASDTTLGDVGELEVVITVPGIESVTTTTSGTGELEVTITLQGVASASNTTSNVGAVTIPSTTNGFIRVEYSVTMSKAVFGVATPKAVFGITISKIVFSLKA
jgi:hypothetical protein